VNVKCSVEDQATVRRQSTYQYDAHPPDHYLSAVTVKQFLFWLAVERASCF